MREHVGKWGEYGGTATVFVERGRVYVRTTVNGERKVHRMGKDTASVRRDAITWAKRYAKARGEIEVTRSGAAGLTLKALVEKYQKANAENWRPKTAKVYAEYIAALYDHFHPSKKIARLTLDEVDDFRSARRGEGIAHSQVRRQIGFLRQLVNWAEGRDLVSRNRLRAYRYVVPKEERDAKPGEYSRAALRAIWDALQGPRHWRARGIITLCGSLGARVNAVLHLQWADVDFETDRVTWRADYDKTGERAVQPLTPKSKAALLEAWQHRHESEPWVFWAVRAKGRPYHYNSVHHHLREAEKRADVPHLAGRAFHGLRRMVVSDMGDLGLAGAWVRQKSLKITASYDREREAKLAEAQARMAEAEGA